MFKKLTCISLIAFTSCVSFPQDQKAKLQAVKTQMPEAYVEVKNPNLAAGLGILPLGVADFYNGNIGLGVANFFGSIIWPISISWTVVGGIDGANEKNYYATKNNLKRLQKKELDALEEKLNEKKITESKYVTESKKIEKKYDMDYML